MSCFPIKKWQAVAQVSRDERVTNGAARLFVVLMDHHNTKSGRCYPSQLRLASSLDCTVRSVRNCLRCLEGAGYVRVLKGEGRAGCDAYWLWFPSGKSGFETAEKPGSMKRKLVSTKPMNEQKNKPLYGVRIAPRKRTKTAASEKHDEVTSEEIQNAEGRIATALGKDGWSMLMGLGDQRVGIIRVQLAKKEISLEAAKRMVLDECIKDTKAENEAL